MTDIDVNVILPSDLSKWEFYDTSTTSLVDPDSNIQLQRSSESQNLKSAKEDPENLKHFIKNHEKTTATTTSSTIYESLRKTQLPFDLSHASPKLIDELYSWILVSDSLTWNLERLESSKRKLDSTELNIWIQICCKLNLMISLAPGMSEKNILTLNKTWKEFFATLSSFILTVNHTRQFLDFVQDKLNSCIQNSLKKNKNLKKEYKRIISKPWDNGMIVLDALLRDLRVENDPVPNESDACIRIHCTDTEFYIVGNFNAAAGRQDLSFSFKNPKTEFSEAKNSIPAENEANFDSNNVQPIPSPRNVDPNIEEMDSREAPLISKFSQLDPDAATDLILHLLSALSFTLESIQLDLKSARRILHKSLLSLRGSLLTISSAMETLFVSLIFKNILFNFSMNHSSLQNLQVTLAEIQEVTIGVKAALNQRKLAITPVLKQFQTDLREMSLDYVSQNSCISSIFIETLTQYGKYLPEVIKSARQEYDASNVEAAIEPTEKSLVTSVETENPLQEQVDEVNELVLRFQKESQQTLVNALWKLKYGTCNSPVEYLESMSHMISQINPIDVTTQHLQQKFLKLTSSLVSLKIEVSKVRKNLMKIRNELNKMAKKIREEIEEIYDEEIPPPPIKLGKATEAEEIFSGPRFQDVELEEGFIELDWDLSQNVSINLGSEILGMETVSEVFKVKILKALLNQSQLIINEAMEILRSSKKKKKSSMQYIWKHFNSPEFQNFLRIEEKESFMVLLENILKNSFVILENFNKTISHCSVSLSIAINNIKNEINPNETKGNPFGYPKLRVRIPFKLQPTQKSLEEVDQSETLDHPKLGESKQTMDFLEFNAEGVSAMEGIVSNLPGIDPRLYNWIVILGETIISVGNFRDVLPNSRSKIIIGMNHLRSQIEKLNILKIEIEKGFEKGMKEADDFIQQLRLSMNTLIPIPNVVMNENLVKTEVELLPTDELQSWILAYEESGNCGDSILPLTLTFPPTDTQIHYQNLPRTKQGRVVVEVIKSVSEMLSRITNKISKSKHSLSQHYHEFKSNSMELRKFLKKTGLPADSDLTQEILETIRKVQIAKSKGFKTLNQLDEDLEAAERILALVLSYGNFRIEIQPCPRSNASSKRSFPQKIVILQKRKKELLRMETEIRQELKMQNSIQIPLNLKTIIKL